MPYEIVTCVLLYVFAVDFSETLPLYCVPSFTGRLVRYTWKLSIGASRGLNADAKIIRIPFQVMTVPGGLIWGLLVGGRGSCAVIGGVHVCVVCDCCVCVGERWDYGLWGLLLILNCVGICTMLTDQVLD